MLGLDGDQSKGGDEVRHAPRTRGLASTSYATRLRTQGAAGLTPGQAPCRYRATRSSSAPKASPAPSAAGYAAHETLGTGPCLMSCHVNARKSQRIKLRAPHPPAQEFLVRMSRSHFLAEGVAHLLSFLLRSIADSDASVTHHGRHKGLAAECSFQ